MNSQVDIAYDDLVWVCTNLCELIEVENQALTDHDSATIEELAENKSALASFYEKLVQPIAENPGLAESLEAEKKEELANLGSRLAELMATNAVLLTAEAEASRRLMEALAAAARNRTGGVSYGPSGTLDLAGDPASVALDKTL